MADNNTKNRVTIYQVAHQANVSLATVSRVINNYPNVTERTRNRVLETIKVLGYKPSALAQGLAKAKTTTIGIVLPEESYVYISNMLAGMCTIAKSYGFQSSLFTTKRIKSDAQAQIEKLITSHVDGAVVYDDELSLEELQQLKKFDIPLVLIGHETQDNLTASVPLDFETGMIESVSKYFQRGGKNVVFLQADNEGFLLESLKEKLRQYCSENKKNFSIIDCDDSYSRLYLDMQTRFKNDPTFSAFIVAPRDSLACAVSNAAVDLGIKVPGQIEIISIIGTKYSYIARPQISSMDLDMFIVGSIAMRMLTKMIKNGDSGLPEKVYPLKAQYVARGTTKDGFADSKTSK